EIKYILSNDAGSTWLYYNNGWVVSDGTYSKANTAAELQSVIQSFPTGSQQLVFKAFLHSNGGQLVSLNHLAIIGGLVTASSTTNAPTVSSPKSSITSLLSGDSLSLAPVVIKGSSSESGASSIQKVEISADDGLHWSEVVPTIANDHYGFDWQYQWTPLSTGSYRLSTRATNWNGAVEFVNSGPTINIVSADRPEFQNQQQQSQATPAPSISSLVSSQSSLQAQIATIEQQLIVLIQQLIQQLLVELQASR
ncbi:MAG: Ig-like domain-containing protein, partial [Patescibacteria group bacterium]|nr:Ig-like domain-containing protein [Patescibacteria group bacterium]